MDPNHLGILRGHMRYLKEDSSTDFIKKRYWYELIFYISNSLSFTGIPEYDDPFNLAANNVSLLCNVPGFDL